MTDITVGDIAARLFISPRQLARIVKQRYGTTLHETIRKKRVTVAAKLLLDGNKTVEEIGHEVGFHSKSCFYRAFYAEFQETPLGYRKNAGNIPAKH